MQLSCEKGHLMLIWNICKNLIPPLIMQKIDLALPKKSGEKTKTPPSENNEGYTH